MAEYDFIVVGAGASGCSLATRIAQSSSRPSVLLLEAGAPNGLDGYMNADQRFNVAFDPASFPNWGYKTTPQHQLSGQEVDYSRGKGLGGTTSINFCGWLVGPRDDYDEWARMMGDQSFAWSNVKKCLDRVSRLDTKIPNSELSKYVDPKISDHSETGVIPLTYGGPWIKDVGNIFLAADQIGITTNKDINNGNPIGLGMGSVNCAEGRRIDATAYLLTAPSNLKVVSGATAARILLRNKKAIGIETIEGQVFHARHEVMISGGALNSPQLCLLSGIGPVAELEKHNIPVLHELPMVGQNLRDHCFSSVGLVVKHDDNFEEHPNILCPSPMAFLKSDKAMNSKEFDMLPKHVQKHIQLPTVPNFEIATHTPPSFLDYTPAPEISFVGAICILDNPQSSGSVTLRSSDPLDAPLIDPKFLSHPFDRQVIIDGVRQTMKLLTAPIYSNKMVKSLGPADDSDEAIWEHVKKHFGSSWHMSCTLGMGLDKDTACVDSNFRMFGLEGLRVVDLSVCPFVPNNHTQSTAYVLGEIAAEKIIRQYGLNDTLVTSISANL